MEFVEAVKLSIEKLDAIPIMAPKRDCREILPAKKGSDHYLCRARRDNNIEQSCKFYQATIATCAGEVISCRYRGDWFPVTGKQFCSITESVRSRLG